MGRVWLLAFGAFAVGTDLFILGGILPELATSLHTTVAAGGQAVTVFAVVYAVATPVLAATSAHLPPRRVLVTALTVFTLANLATALAPDLGVLLGTRVFAALGAAGFTPAALGTATALVPPQQRGRALATVMSGLNGAIALGVPVGTTLAQTAGWRSALLLVAVLGATGAVAVAVGLGKVSPHPAASLAERIAVVRDRRVLAVLAVTVLGVAAGILAYTFIADILRETTGATGVTLTVLLVLYGLGAFGGSLASGPLTDRLGANRVITATLLTLLVTLLVVPVVHSVVAVGVVAIVWGAAMVAFTPPQQHRLIDASPEQPTVVVSLNSSALYLGQAVGAALGGIALGVGVGFAQLPLIGAGLTVLGLGAHLATLRTHPVTTAGRP